MKRILAIVLLFVSVLVSSVFPSSVSACSCVAPSSPLEEIEKFDAVFSGIVTNIREEGGILNLPQFRVEFEVESSWKGVNEPVVSILTTDNSAACGFGFNEGEKYIVYARSYESELHVNLCSRTALFVKASEDVEAFGEPEYVSAEQTEDVDSVVSEGNTRMLGVGFIVGIIAGAIVIVMVSRYRKDYGKENSIQSPPTNSGNDTMTS